MKRPSIRRLFFDGIPGRVFTCGGEKTDCQCPHRTKYIPKMRGRMSEENVKSIIVAEMERKLCPRLCVAIETEETL